MDCAEYAYTPGCVGDPQINATLTANAVRLVGDGVSQMIRTLGIWMKEPRPLQKRYRRCFEGRVDAMLGAEKRPSN